MASSSAERRISSLRTMLADIVVAPITPLYDNWPQAIASLSGSSSRLRFYETGDAQWSHLAALFKR